MKSTLSLFSRFLGISAAALLLAGCAEMQQMQGGGSGSGGSGYSSGSSASVSSSDVASGHAGDTLDACLSRIPSNSTDGQRLVATTTCNRDEAARQPIVAVPGN
jgi:hypothetical protein